MSIIITLASWGFGVGLAIGGIFAGAILMTIAAIFVIAAVAALMS